MGNKKDKKRFLFAGNRITGDFDSWLARYSKPLPQSEWWDAYCAGSIMRLIPCRYVSYPKMYLSGAITGLNKAATARKFAQAEQEAIKKGYTPVSPLKNGLPESASYEQHMERDLELLRGCDAVLMLPDWGDSPGARRELEEAVKQNKKIIFYKSLNNKTMENLLNCDGFYYKAKINETEIAGRIRVEGDRVYLCQDYISSGQDVDRFGYSSSYYVGHGDAGVMESKSVRYFHLLTPEEAEQYKDWRVGDIVMDNYGGTLEVIFRSGELVVAKDIPTGLAQDNRTCEELYNEDYRLVLPTAQKEKGTIREVTLDDIAEKFGVPVDKIRVKY